MNNNFCFQIHHHEHNLENDYFLGFYHQILPGDENSCVRVRNLSLSDLWGVRVEALKITRALSHFQTLKDEGKSCPENAKLHL